MVQRQSELKSIGQVAEELSRDFPGISVSALRFLEREGLLSPTRKPGGHRLYSEADVARARTIKQWQKQRLSLKEIRERLERADSMGSDLPAERILQHILAHEIEQAVEIVAELSDAGRSLLDLCDGGLTPVLVQLADGDGNLLIPVDVQLELDEAISALLARISPPPTDAAHTPVVVAACPAWERHDLALRMLSALLTERGAAVHMLGSQVEIDFLVGAVHRIRPDFVLVSVSTTPLPPQAGAWFTQLADSLEGSQRLEIGGQASEKIAETVAAHEAVSVHGQTSCGEVIDQLMVVAK